MTTAEPFVSRLRRQLETGREGRILQELEDIHVVDIAQALSEMPGAEQLQLFQVLDRVRAAQVLQCLDADTLRDLLPQIDHEWLATVLDLVPVHHMVAMFTRLGVEEQTVVRRLLSDDRANGIEKLLRYQESTAGRLMSPTVTSMSETVTVAEALARIRQGAGSEPTPMVYVVDEHQHLINVLPMGRLIVAAPQTPLWSFEHRPVTSVTVGTTQDEVARVMRRYRLWSVPVLDEQRRVAGSIAIHDIIPALQRGRQPVSAHRWLGRMRRWLLTWYHRDEGS